MSYQEKGVAGFCFVVVVMFGISAGAVLGRSAKLSSESSEAYAALRENPSHGQEDNELKQYENDKVSIGFIPA